MGKGLGREFQTRLDISIARSLDLADHRLIIGRIAYDRHIPVILGRAAQHRRTADIYILDGILHRHVGLGYGLTEGIEVNADHVYELDAVLLQRLKVARVVTARQQTAMHLRVERLHTAVTYLGEPRDVAYVYHLHALLAQKFHRTARGDNLPAGRAQTLCELHNTALVADTDQSSHIKMFYIISAIYLSYLYTGHAPRHVSPP